MRRRRCSRLSQTELPAGIHRKLRGRFRKTFADVPRMEKATLKQTVEIVRAPGNGVNPAMVIV